jgi:membrane protein implicated in regulation of membrane protease activity
VTSTNGNTNGNNPKRRGSAHPYRDSALAYAGLGALVVAFASLTGSGLVKSFAGGAAAFVLATAWTWWRMRSREQEPDRRAP